MTNALKSPRASRGRAGLALMVMGLVANPGVGGHGLVHAQAPAIGTPLPSWQIADICAKDSAQGQCIAFEATARKSVAASWPFVFDDVRKTCLAAAKPGEQSWRVLSDCVDATMEQRGDQRAVKTRATPGEPVPPSRLESEAQRRAEEDAAARKRAEDEAARQKAEADARARAEAEQKAKADADARLKAEAEEKAKAEADLKAKADADRARADADARAKADADARVKAEAEQKAKAEAELKAKADADRARADADARAKADADARLKAEAEQKAKAEAEKARLEAAARAKAEAELKAKTDAEARARADADAKAKAAAEVRRRACQEPVTAAAKSGAIRFRIESATLQPDSIKVLTAVAAAFKQCADVNIIVEGHTDNAGDDAINQPLSDARAQAVRDFLIKAGVNADRISAQGFGSKRPSATNDTAEGRALNRRIDFVVAAP